jgi:nicotinic acid mononucleotide adenylyltransferase
MIKEIHESNIFGIIIESGCSTATASTLMNVAGSSNTIYKCEQPYNKNYQTYKYGEFKRSVSKEWVEKVLNVEYENYLNENYEHDKEINFILASSWQLIDPKDPLVYTHGWFGLYDIRKNRKLYFHFSFQRDVNNEYLKLIDKKCYNNTHDADRELIIEFIGNLGIQILNGLLKDDFNNLYTGLAILDMAYIENNINYELLINNLENSEKDYFLVFDKNNVIRFEDLMRQSDEFVINKGSFEILHYGHLNMMDESLKKYTNSKGAFLIGLYRYDKPHLSTTEIIDRANQIIKQGYPVIICKSILFYETFDLLKEWSYNKKFRFPLGIDTINRISQTDIDNNVDICEIINKYKKDFKFLLFNRLNYNRDINTHVYNLMLETFNNQDDGISSTAIKKGLMKNLL